MPRPRSPQLVFSHYMTALAVFLKGVAKADDLSHNWPLVLLCCSFGVLILLFTVFHHQIERRWFLAPPLISLLESIVLAAVGVYSLRHGQHLLPYAWFLAATLTAVATVVQLVALRRQQARAVSAAGVEEPPRPDAGSAPTP